MHSLIWYTVTFGIPLLGVGICIAAGVFVYQWARLHRISRMLAAVIYLFATLLPLVLARMAIGFGSYLGSRRGVDVFFGENTWALAICMGYYCILAIICNLVIWLVLYCEVAEERG